MERAKNMARKLPEYSIAGTTFTVDARIYEFRETAAPWNKISMDDFWEEGPTHILFDTQAKNIYTGATHIANRPAHVPIVIVPPLTELDPVGLARHYDLADDAFIPAAQKQRVTELTSLEQNERKHQKGRGIN